MLNHSINVSRFKKRERTQNWAYEEKRFLLELCRKDINVIENKRLDADLTSLKNRAWRIIHQEFVKSFGNERNCNRLKEQWRRMKACTRAEIIDYHHRVSKYGQEIADKKRPNPFSFEIWEFMQEAKRICRSESNVDYSKVNLVLENELPDGVALDDTEDEESNNVWQKATQNICEVEIKDEPSDDTEQTDDEPVQKRPYQIPQINVNYQTNGIQYLPVNNDTVNGCEISSINKLASQSMLLSKTPQIPATIMSQTSHQHTIQNDNDIPSLSINNVATTLDTLNLIRNGQLNHIKLKSNENHQMNGASSSTSSSSTPAPTPPMSSTATIIIPTNSSSSNSNDSNIKYLLDLQNKEHNLRMEILQIQLETAKCNRNAAEINKMIALKNLSLLSNEMIKK